MDKEFLSFCSLIIIFFSNETVEKTAQELINCMNCTMLLRGNNEKIYRILLREADDRGLLLTDYLEILSQFNLNQPEIVEIPILVE